MSLFAIQVIRLISIINWVECQVSVQNCLWSESGFRTEFISGPNCGELFCCFYKPISPFLYLKVDTDFSSSNCLQRNDVQFTIWQNLVNFLENGPRFSLFDGISRMTFQDYWLLCLHHEMVLGMASHEARINHGWTVIIIHW